MITLKLEELNHYALRLELTPCSRPTELQNQREKQTHTKRDQFVVTRGKVGRRRIWMKVVKEGYKLPVITRDVMYNMINTINTAVCYITKLLTVNPEFSSQKFFLFDFISI